jgi:hypothetical protein
VVGTKLAVELSVGPTSFLFGDASINIPASFSVPSEPPIPNSENLAGCFFGPSLPSTLNSRSPLSSAGTRSPSGTCSRKSFTLFSVSPSLEREDGGGFEE